MIDVAGEITFDDYVRAQRVHGRRQTVVVSVLLVAIAGISVLFAPYAFGALLLVYLAVRPVVFRARCRRLWNQTPAVRQGEISYGLDERGLHMRDDEGRPAVTHWDKFLKFRESRDFFLLYLSPRLFVYLPKRLISAEDQEGVRRLLAEQIGKGT